MKEDLQRVFIHELGHFIAAELSYTYLNYDRRIEIMELYKRGNTDFYDGRTSTSLATLDSYNPENSANEYLQLFYGCLFETLHREIDINDCLCSKVSVEENFTKNIGNGELMTNLCYNYHIGLKLLKYVSNGTILLKKIFGRQ